MTDGQNAVTPRGDRLLLIVLLAGLALASALTPIRNFDYWWHLKTGELILARHEIPRTDPYSFTAAGTAWVDHEWLAQVLMVAGHGLLGPAGLVVLKALLTAGLCLLMITHVRREGHGPAGTAILLAVTLLGVSFRLDVRPELATLAILPLAIHCVLLARDTGDRRALALVPVLVAIGSNLHPGVVLVPVLLLVGAFLSSGRPFARPLLLTALAAAGAACLNPFGYRIYAVPFELRRLLASLPSPNLEWGRPQFSDFPLFWLTAGAAIVLTLAAWRRIDPIATPALLCCAVLAAAHLRNIGPFFMLVPYGLARPARVPVAFLERLWARVARFAPGVRPGFVIAAVVLVCALPALWIVPPPFAWGAGVAPGNQPAAAVDFVEREGIGRRLYNDVRFGGYLIWRRFPSRQVFIDGRNEVYPVLLREVFASLADSRDWTAFLGRHDIDAAFLRYAPALEKVLRPGGDGGPGRVVERAFSANHFPKESWALVYWDDEAMVMARRSPENAAVIARNEYRAVQPEDWRYLYASVLTGREAVGPILDDLERKLREDPGCGLARSLRARFGQLAGEARTRTGPPATGG